MQPIDYGAPWRVNRNAEVVYYGCQPVGPRDPYVPLVPAPGDWFPPDQIVEPSPIPQPIRPLSPEELVKMTAALRPLLDEFAIMSALDKLDDAAKHRVEAWLRARLDMTPDVVPR